MIVIVFELVAIDFGAGEEIGVGQAQRKPDGCDYRNCCWRCRDFSMQIRSTAFGQAS
jgi:hypothetical protein